MKYKTILRCPTCNAIIEEIEHDQPELSGMSEAMLGQPARTEHARTNQPFVNAATWLNGWESETVEIADDAK